MSFVVHHDVELAQRTTFGVGGRARTLVSVWDPRALPEVVSRFGPVRVLGGGSNVLVADEGVAETLIHLLPSAPERAGGHSTAEAGLTCEVESHTVRLHAAAGMRWDDVVAYSVQRGWQGLECLSGIPGTVGAAPIQNIGAYGQEVADVVEAVEVYDLGHGSPRSLPAAECGFGYRTSRFKGQESQPPRAGEAGPFVVTGVRLRLKADAPGCTRYRDVAERLPEGGSVASVRAAVLEVRYAKGMLVHPALGTDARSAGSFFVNPVVPDAVAERITATHPDIPSWRASASAVKLSAAWLIERAGIARGYRRGRAAISSRHTLALTALDGATAAEVVALGREVRARVLAAFGISLDPEPVLLGFYSDVWAS